MTAINAMDQYQDAINNREIAKGTSIIFSMCVVGVCAVELY
jgi:hypothetical protein